MGVLSWNVSRALTRKGVLPPQVDEVMGRKDELMDREDELISHEGPDDGGAVMLGAEEVNARSGSFHRLQLSKIALRWT